MRAHFVYDGDDVADALIRSSHFAVHVYSEGGISVLATRDDGYVADAVLDDVGSGTRMLTIHGCTGSSSQPSAAAAMAELDWRNAVMQVRACEPKTKPHKLTPSLMQRILERCDSPHSCAPACTAVHSSLPCSHSPNPPASPGSQRLSVRDSKSKQQQQHAALPLATPCSPSRRNAFKNIHRCSDSPPLHHSSPSAAPCPSFLLRITFRICCIFVGAGF